MYTKGKEGHIVLCSELSRKVRGKSLGIAKDGLHGAIGIAFLRVVSSLGCYKSSTYLLLTVNHPGFSYAYANTLVFAIAL